MPNKGLVNFPLSRRLISLACSAGISFLASACQSVPPVDLEETGQFAELVEFLEANNLTIGDRATNLVESQIIDWGNFDSQALFLVLDSNRLVLVTVDSLCKNLERARYISFEPRSALIIPNPLNPGLPSGVVKEEFTQYLGRGDRLLLAQTQEELIYTQMQRMPPDFFQLGDCTVGELYYLNQLN